MEEQVEANGGRRRKERKEYHHRPVEPARFRIGEERRPSKLIRVPDWQLAGAEAVAEEGIHRGEERGGVLSDNGTADQERRRREQRQQHDDEPAEESGGAGRVQPCWWGAETKRAHIDLLYAGVSVRRQQGPGWEMGSSQCGWLVH